MKVSSLRIPALAAALVLSLVPAQAKDKEPKPDKELAKYAGEYTGETRTKTESLSQSEMQDFSLKHHSISLSLGADGTATLSQSPNGDNEVTTFGNWKVSGGQITITFESSPGGDTPAPMTFSTGHNELTPVTYDHNLWGKLPPPPMKRGGDERPAGARKSGGR